MTRTGKIARLPRDVREELNLRLADGELGKELVVWLNGLPGVRSVMESDFKGVQVSEQNLSEWKQGGYLEWQRHQEVRHCLLARREAAQALSDEAGSVPLSEDSAPLLALALGQMLNDAVQGSLNQPEQRQQFFALGRELRLLRRQDHEAARLKIILAKETRKAAARERAKILNEKIKPLSMLRQGIEKERVLRGLLENFPEEMRGEIREFLGKLEGPPEE